MGTTTSTSPSKKRKFGIYQQPLYVIIYTAITCCTLNSTVPMTSSSLKSTASFADASTSGDKKEDIEQLTKPSTSLQQHRSPTYSPKTIDNNKRKGKKGLK